jgi:AcrR family transcriptional regulator
MSTRPAYHHGSLRETLVRACLDLIRTEGIGAVSLRRVAREAGVSPGAPYHHFADRAALLTAISAQGLQLLRDRLVEARAAASTSGAALVALVEAYVRFATGEPAYFHLMFRPELAQPDKDPAGTAAADESFRVLCEVVADCQRDGAAPPGPIEPLAGLVWSLSHGLAALWIDGPLVSKLTGSPEQLLTQVSAGLAAILQGASRAGVRLGPPGVGPPDAT